MSMTDQPKPLTRKQCAGILHYAQGYLDGHGYAPEYPGLLIKLSAALFDSSEEVTAVGWQIENIRHAASAASSYGANDIAKALRHVATTLGCD